MATNSPSLEDILDVLVTAVIRLDHASRVSFLNPAAADLLETSPKHARGRRLRELLPVDEQLQAYVDRALANGEPLTVAELDLVCGVPPGRRRIVACDILPLDSGDAVQVELKPLDQRGLVAEETGLWRDHQAQRLLFQALAHEIKNPLSGLRGAAQLLATEAGDVVPREYLDIMLRETDRLRDLVDALLGPARAPRFAATNIHAVLEHVHGLATLDSKTLRWERDYDPSLPEILADADQLTQVFLNLAGNAVEAMSRNGGKERRLAVRTRVERQYASGGRQHHTAIRVDVEDNGPGVPEALKKSLFLPLVTSRPEGTGLGLPIAQDIVQRHGGLIEWKSEPGRTVFSVVLPVDGRIESATGTSK